MRRGSFAVGVCIILLFGCARQETQQVSATPTGAPESTPTPTEPQATNLGPIATAVAYHLQEPELSRPDVVYVYSYQPLTPRDRTEIEQVIDAPVEFVDKRDKEARHERNLKRSRGEAEMRDFEANMTIDTKELSANRVDVGVFFNHPELGRGAAYKVERQGENWRVTATLSEGQS